MNIWNVTGRQCSGVCVLAVVLSAAFALSRSSAGEAFDPATLKPFTSGEAYLGSETGLYPGGKIEMPAAHRKAGERLAAQIQPLDAQGKPDPKGRILALAMGHSNCKMYMGALIKKLAEQKNELKPQFELVSCAVGGNQLPEISGNYDGPVWLNMKKATERPGCSNLQVQALFVHTTWHGAGNGKRSPPEEFPAEMKKMQAALQAVLQKCATLYPNLKIAFVTCDGLRHFTGFEPHVWREAFAFKWLIENQIKGEAGTEFEGEKRKIPWLEWGPYIWDNTWDRSYFSDGVHPAQKAQDIVIDKYWKHLTEDSVARIGLFKPKSAP